jgi:hypothetical protein
MRIKCLILWIACLCFTESALAKPLPTITFSCSIPSNFFMYKELTARYTKAFNALGYHFEMVPAKSMRSAVNANNGIVDGDCLRAETFGADELPHLLKVDVKLGSIEFGAWSANPSLKVIDGASIAAQHLSVGFPRGNLVSEKFVVDFQITDVTRTSDLSSAIKMLSVKRFDLLLIATEGVEQQLDVLTLANPIYKVATFFTLNTYPLIHERFEFLIPSLIEELHKVIPADGISLGTKR